MDTHSLFKLLLKFFRLSSAPCPLQYVYYSLPALCILTLQTFLFQKLANTGGIWDQGRKKVSPPPENSTDRLD